MIRDDLELTPEQAAYWARRMVKAAGGADSVSAALGVDRSLVTRWCSADYSETPNQRRLVELMILSPDKGFLAYLNQLCGLDQGAWVIQRRKAMADAAWDGLYDKDADDMLHRADARRSGQRDEE